LWNALHLLHRWLLVIPLFAWLPPLILSVLNGQAWGKTVQVPFLSVIEVHVQFLLAVHTRLRSAIRLFLERGLIPDASRVGSTRPWPRPCACATPW
jgi:hypothetical protein